MDVNTEENRDRRLDNLIPFKAGESGNLNGRPNGQRNYATIYKEALLKLAESEGKTPDELENELIAGGFTQAKKDYRFYRDILDRLHGTPVQKIDHTTKGESFAPGVVEKRVDDILSNGQGETKTGDN